jgi:hypothetical protein
MSGSSYSHHSTPRLVLDDLKALTNLAAELQDAQFVVLAQPRPSGIDGSDSHAEELIPWLPWLNPLEKRKVKSLGKKVNLYKSTG